MGKVYLAEDPALKRLVALKVLSDALASRPDVAERFLREARAMAAVDHPRVVQIHAFGEAAGQPYFVMQYVEGESLAHRIQRKGQLGVEEALKIVDQTADALDAAWKRRLIHRDLKPGNILLDADSEVRVADFGLAKILSSGEAERDTALTLAGQALGTPAYMSPEQGRGAHVDFRTDIYSLGIVLYEMLCGAPPFEGATVHAIIAQHIHEPLPSLRKLRPELTVSLEQLVEWMTQKEPANRPSSYHSLREAVRQLLDASGLLVPSSRDSSIATVTLAAAPALRPVTPSAGAEEASGTPVSRKATERRQATVLSVEVSRLDLLAEALGPEEAASLSNRCFERFSSIVQHYQGFITGICQGTMTVLFGVSAASEEAPKDAVNAAIAVRNALPEFVRDTRVAAGLHVRMGIDTGTIIAGRVGEGPQASYTYMGEALDAAAALRHAALEDQICVGLLTHQHTSTEFRYRTLKSIVRPDRKQGWTVYELLSSREKPYRADLSSRLRISSELVGRKVELGKLELHVLRVINGQGSLVSLTGDAGIGKSRLIAELRTTCRDKRVTFLEGRSMSLGRNLGFHPIIDILKHWVDVREEDSSAEIARKLEGAIARVCPARLDEIFPSIAALMGLKPGGRHAGRLEGIPGDVLMKVILKNLRDLVGRASEVRPIVFVLEDLHWADLSTIEFLESLYRLAKSHPVLFINVLRPGYQETGERILGILRSFGELHEQIVLQPLTDSQCEVLIHNLLRVQDLPPKVRQLVVGKAEGNPFFVEEVGRSFIDEGIVVLGSGGFRITEKIDDIVIPETIQHLLLARVDRLDEGTRELVRIASVIGRRFLHKILACVAGALPDLDARLQYLAAIQFVEKRKTQGDFEYVFKHVLVQEVIYDAILARDRKALHRKVAQAIESVYRHRLNEFLGMLALHYCQAEDLEKTEEYMIRAGEEALRSSGSTEALHYYRKALEIYLKKHGKDADPERVARLERNIALALYNRGQYSEAVSCFNTALERYGARVPRSRLSLGWHFAAGAVDFLFSVHFPALKFRREPSARATEIIQLYYKKLSALAQQDPGRFFMECPILARMVTRFDLQKLDNGVGMFASTANLLAWTGISFYLSERVLRLLRSQVGDAGLRAGISYAAAEVTHNFFAGAWGKSVYDDDLVRQALDAGEIFLSSNYLSFHARTAIEEGRVSDAESLISTLRQIGEQYEHLYPLALHHYLRSKLLVKARRLTDALTPYNEAVQFTEKTGLEALVFGAHAFKAQAQLWLGEIEDAEETLRRLDEMRARVKLTYYLRGEYLHSRCLLDLHYLNDARRQGSRADRAGIQQRAERSCCEFLRNARKVASDRTEGNRLLGRYHWLVGNRKKAFHAWEASMRIGEQLGAIPDLARAYMEVGVRLHEAGEKFAEWKGATGDELLEKAKTLLLRVGFDWDLSGPESATWS